MWCTVHVYLHTRNAGQNVSRDFGVFHIEERWADLNLPIKMEKFMYFTWMMKSNCETIHLIAFGARFVANGKIIEKNEGEQRRFPRRCLVKTMFICCYVLIINNVENDLLSSELITLQHSLALCALVMWMRHLMLVCLVCWENWKILILVLGPYCCQKNTD